MIREGDGDDREAENMWGLTEFHSGWFPKKLHSTNTASLALLKWVSCNIGLFFLDAFLFLNLINCPFAV